MSTAHRLADELETAWRWWDRQGQPGFERFELTVAAQGHTVWLDSPRHPGPVRAT